ncbi:MAG: sugar transferase [Melioribacteraceae bacterium]|nr:sugar transferase [Melioribacteraceae bacterium]
MYKLLKSLIDRLTALLLIIVTLPITFLTGLGLLFQNKGVVFFLHPRPGKNEKVFKVIKFQTMNNKKDENGNLLPDEERLTTLGKLVRKISIDELPQMINVLKGDMSLIGPRPLLIEYLPLYNEEQKRRHDVKPGITGWAQVNGRNAISWEEKFRYDVWYVDNISFLLDVKIFWLTIVKIFKREGISSDTHATMEKFEGTKE